jgi:hypothetical protein
MKICNLAAAAIKENNDQFQYCPVVIVVDGVEREIDGIQMDHGVDVLEPSQVPAQPKLKIIAK